MTDESAVVRVVAGAPVGELVLDRPTRRNAIVGPTVEELLAGLDALRRDEAVAVVLLRGEGGCFSSGLDRDAFAADPAPPWRAAFAERWLELHVALCEYPKPVIGALERFAIAGGSGLALACDLLVAGESAWLQVAEAELGMAAPMNVAWLCLKVGAARAFDLTLTARRVPAAELQRMGLVVAVVDDSRVVEEARSLGERLAAHPGRPHAATRRIVAATVPGGARAWFAVAARAAREESR